jgi:hypothetical protein
MKWVKRILVTLVAFVAMLGFTSLFLPSEVAVTTTKTIKAEAATVVHLVSTPNTWLSWSPWNEAFMPKRTSTYEGPESGVGARWVWKDPEHGDGTLEITKVDGVERVDYTLEFTDFEPMISHVALAPDGEGVAVTWASVWHIGANPFWRWMGLLMSDAMAEEYNRAIDGLEKAANAK